MGKKLSGTKIQIFASDISENAIRTARTAVYSKASVQMLTEAQLKNYFIKNNGGYEVSKLIRDMCVFAPHNFLKDPPFAKMDLISCRNVLIYMDTFLQKKALTVFHYALKENGFLLLGKSESTSPVSELFGIYDKHEKIYSRKAVPGRFIHVTSDSKEEALAIKEKRATKQEPVFTDFRKSAEAILLSKFTPASVVVNEQMDIVHIHGIITPFLETPQGKPTFNLMKMAREGLAFELRNALHKAKTSKEPVIKENIPVKTNTQLNDEDGQGKQLLVTIEVIPLTNTVEPHYLISFNKMAMALIPYASEISGVKRKNNEAQQLNKQLENELAHTREDMRSITEDMEAANEELQSANEELQSSNEEMQSLNEELETSKEELQSTNEELTIVNQELIDKQEQLNAARLYSESIVTTIREPLIILDKVLRIKTANNSFYKRFNTTEEETEGKLFYEIQNQQWNDIVIRSLLENVLSKSEGLTDYEIILKFPVIGERTLLLNALKIVNEKNNEQLILLAIEDITERTLYEKKIQESEERFTTIINKADLGLWDLDVFNENVIVTGKMAEIYGLASNAEYTISTVFKLIHPDDRAAMNKIFNSIKEGTDQSSFTTEYRIIQQNTGAIRWVRNKTSCFYTGEGKLYRTVGIVNDITQEKEAELAIEESALQFKSLANTIPQLAWMADAQGSVYWYNQRWFDYTGTTLKEMEGWGWQTVQHPDMLEAVTEKFKNAIALGELWEDTFLLRSKTGEYRWFLSRANAVHNRKGEIVKWFGTNTDITDQKNISKALSEAKNVAENALKAKQQFLSNMSHEIRTPMNAIIGFTNVLLRTELKPKQAEYISAIKTSGDELIVLINDILDLAKIDAGKMRFVHKPFKMALSISAMLHLFELKFQEKHLELVQEYDSKIPEILLGDPLRLHQIILNLISNALKFTAKGKVIVSIILLSEDEKKVSIEFKVTDTGIGIAENNIAEIFENFQQATTNTSILYGGTGLGLAIVKQLVEQQGGTISVKSKMNEGSTFSFILSFQKTESEIELESGVEELSTENKNIKILVAEDVALNQLLIKSILDDFKFDCDIADNGKIAIEKLQTKSYDIILMDMLMPEMNGVEATEYIRNKMNSKIPIIALTADVTTVDLAKCKAIGMNDYIAKPIDENLLYRKIVNLLKPNGDAIF